MQTPATQTPLAGAVHELARNEFHHTFGEPRQPLQPDAEWQKLRDVGTQLWLDTGDADEAGRLLSDEFSALTTNNTLLNKEVQKGLYDDLVSQAAQTIRSAAPDLSEQDLVLELAFLLNARHALMLVQRFDVNVSVELHTDLAHDVERSVQYGERYYAICPERFIVKVPLTAAGLLAARHLVEKGIPINFTLGFSARQNYLAAVLARPDFVNVFMGRLNAFVADNELGSGENVGEKATLATQRAILGLREAGTGRSHLIGASMRTGDQVATLAGLDVFTMPPKVAQQYREAPADTIATQVSNDPSVPLHQGVALDDFYGASLWEVNDAFRDAADAIAARDYAALSADDVIEHFAQRGFADLLPKWSKDEEATVHADGKIPVYTTWKDRLQSRTIGLDALMNLSALHSFMTDQAALDDRIRKHL